MTLFLYYLNSIQSFPDKFDLDWLIRPAVDKTILEEDAAKKYVQTIMCNILPSTAVRVVVVMFNFVKAILIDSVGLNAKDYQTVSQKHQQYYTKFTHQSFAKQYIITLSLIPILSPLAWKYYYVFLTPLIILLIYYQRKDLIKPWFYIPLILITLTSELFIGHHLSDVTEAIGVITFCSLGISIYATNKILNN